MVSSPLTLLAVHAHPDDEAISTGGVLSRYAREGIRTVLVTCTDGRCGDGPNGVKPGQPGHDPEAVVRLRRQELEASCGILGIAHLELLGYRDSGMMGWPDNDRPESFWSLPVEEAARPLVGLFERYRPQVVVTYDANGFYGHPDHIQAHRITLAAAEHTGIPAKIYFPTVPRSALASFAERLRAAGVEPPGGEDGLGADFGSPDDAIAAWIDVASEADRKYDALAAHASQSDNIFFLGLGRTVFGEIMGREAFLRHFDHTGSPLPEDDLFSGLRTPPEL
ncbi:MAG: PIG-L family deacetylase [Acidimicrobiales bacterium]